MKSPNGIRSAELVANNGRDHLYSVANSGLDHMADVIFPLRSFLSFEVFKIKKNKLYIKIVEA